MKFADPIQQLLWTTDQHMAYFNLPPILVQHMMQVQDLNGSLIDLIKFLTEKYIAKQNPLVVKQSDLNPLATPFMHKTGEIVETKEQEQTEKTIDPERLNVNEWMKVAKGCKHKATAKHVISEKTITYATYFKQMRTMWTIEAPIKQVT